MVLYNRLSKFTKKTDNPIILYTLEYADMSFIPRLDKDCFSVINKFCGVLHQGVSQYNDLDQIRFACAHGLVDVVGDLLGDEVTGAELKFACNYGHVDIVTLFYNKFGREVFEINSHDYFRRAAVYGHLNVLKWLHEHFPKYIMHGELKTTILKTFSKTCTSTDVVVLTWLKQVYNIFQVGNLNEDAIIGNYNFTNSFINDLMTNQNLDVLSFYPNEVIKNNLIDLNYNIINKQLANCNIDMLLWIKNKFPEVLVDAIRRYYMQAVEVEHEQRRVVIFDFDGHGIHYENDNNATNIQALTLLKQLYPDTFFIELFQNNNYKFLKQIVNNNEIKLLNKMIDLFPKQVDKAFDNKQFIDSIDISPYTNWLYHHLYDDMCTPKNKKILTLIHNKINYNGNFKNLFSINHFFPKFTIKMLSDIPDNIIKNYLSNDEYFNMVFMFRSYDVEMLLWIKDKFPQLLHNAVRRYYLSSGDLTLAFSIYCQSNLSHKHNYMSFQHDANFRALTLVKQLCPELVEELFQYRDNVILIEIMRNDDVKLLNEINKLCPELVSKVVKSEVCYQFFQDHVKSTQWFEQYNP